MDSYATGVDGFADAPALPDLYRCAVDHYRVHKRGLPHIAFRRNYMSQLRALLPLPAVLPTAGESPCSSLMCPAGSPNAVVASPRTSRRAVRRRRPVRVMESPVPNVPVLTVQDPLAAAGAVVLDCRPPLLPVSMDLLAIRAPAIRTSDSGSGDSGSGSTRGAGVLPPEREQLFGGGDLLSLICPELGVTPLVDPGTDVEDEWPTPAVSPVPVVNGVAPLSAQADVYIELCQVFQDVRDGDPRWRPGGGGGSVVTPARYPVPPVPDSSVVMAEPLEVTSPAGPTGEGPAIPRSSTGSVVRSLHGVSDVTGDVHA